MRVRAFKLQVGDETLKGFIVTAIEQADPRMLKVTYDRIIPNTDRDWEFVSINENCYIRDKMR